jgi:hypothetical protein
MSGEVLILVVIWGYLIYILLFFRYIKKIQNCCCFYIKKQILFLITYINKLDLKARIVS